MDLSGNCTCYLCYDDELSIVDVASQACSDNDFHVLILWLNSIPMFIVYLLLYISNFTRSVSPVVSLFLIFLIKLLQWFNAFQLQGLEYFV